MAQAREKLIYPSKKREKSLVTFLLIGKMRINALIDFLKEYEEFIPVMVKRKLMVDPALRFIVSACGRQGKLRKAG